MARRFPDSRELSVILPAPVFTGGDVRDRCAYPDLCGFGAEHPGALCFRFGQTKVASERLVDMSNVEAQRPARGSAAETEKVQVRNLNFYYGQAHALKDVSLNLLKGEVTAFIGPSGCGKSTLLRVLNRMYDLYPGQRAEGEVLLDGENILSPS